MTVIATALWPLSNPVLAGELAHERAIHLKGTTNTRDIGGYQTGDMNTLRLGQIIRSDKLSGLTASDFRKLEEMGLKTVIDLRTRQEHAESPTVWKGDQPPRFYHFPAGNSDNAWFKARRKMVQKNSSTGEQALEHMTAGCRMFLDEGTTRYRQLMEVVLNESNWPVPIHCSAGKDRSGIAVALILEALGMERKTIMQEYLPTNEISRIGEKAVMLSRARKMPAGEAGAARVPRPSPKEE